MSFSKLNVSFGRLQNLIFLSLCSDLIKNLKQVFKKNKKKISRIFGTLTLFVRLVLS